MPATRQEDNGVLLTEVNGLSEAGCPNFGPLAGLRLRATLVGEDLRARNEGRFVSSRTRNARCQRQCLNRACTAAFH